MIYFGSTKIIPWKDIIYFLNTTILFRTKFALQVFKIIIVSAIVTVLNPCVRVGCFFNKLVCYVVIGSIILCSFITSIISSIIPLSILLFPSYPPFIIETIETVFLIPPIFSSVVLTFHCLYKLFYLLILCMNSRV